MRNAAPDQDQILRPAPPRRRSLSLHPITWTLLAFSFLNLAAATLAVRSLAPRDLGASSAAYAARFSLRRAADDSWTPMRLALDELRASRAERIYRSLFFDRKIKFQYPPSSLLALDLLDSLAGRPVNLRLLNTISWLCVLTLAVLAPAVYLLVLRDFSPGMWGRFTRRDLGVQSVVLALMTLTFYPVTRGFALGQIQTWLTCLFAAAVLAWVAGREALAGVLIGVIVSVKPQLGVLLLWGAVQRRRGFLVGSAAAVLVLESLSLWRYGLQNHLDYLSVLSFLSAHGESFFANQSVNGLLARLLHVGNNLEWDAHNFPPFHPFIYYGTLVTSCLMIALALFWAWKQQGREAMLVKFVVASLLLTMASPIAWEHHYGLLVPVYAVLLPIFLKSAPPRKWLVCLGLSYFMCSNSFPFANLAANTSWNFVQSYLFAGAALLLLTVINTLAPAWRRIKPAQS